MQNDEHVLTRQDTADAAKPGKNMHEGVEVWEDTCVCEAEPRWQALGEELEAQAKNEIASKNEPKR